MRKLMLLFIAFILLTACTMKEEDVKTYNNIRLAMSAGQFYPGDADRLKFKIENYLKNVTSPPDGALRNGASLPSSSSAEASAEEPKQGEGDKVVKAIIVPHAGYQFSGQVAAQAYKLLEGRQVKTAVIISNSHTSFFDGVAVDTHDAWETPLGIVPVDQELAKKLTESDDDIKFDGAPHDTADQTVEVQVPFLQTVLEEGFQIVPIFFGNNYDDSYKKLAQALADNLGEDDIVVISTDMSHYPSYEDANKIDQETLEIIMTADVAKLDEHIVEVMNQAIPNEDTVLCGRDGARTVMEMYNLLGWDNIEVLKYANSGDVEIGDKDSVVGYGSVVFLKNQTTPVPSSSEEGDEEAAVEGVLNSEQKKKLLEIARETVESYVRTGKVLEFEVSDARLNRKEGAFVTINKDGELRGCIGQIMPSNKPLWKVVRDMAIEAATKDSRFNPVSVDELEDLEYEVSILSVPEPIDDWQKIELGKHGVIVRKGIRSGVFLPQVATDTGWTIDEFLGQLCYQKAGLAPDCYKNDPDVELEIYTAQVFSEEDIE